MERGIWTFAHFAHAVQGYSVERDERLLRRRTVPLRKLFEEFPGNVDSKEDDLVQLSAVVELMAMFGPSTNITVLQVTSMTSMIMVANHFPMKVRLVVAISVNSNMIPKQDLAENTHDLFVLFTNKTSGKGVAFTMEPGSTLDLIWPWY